MSKYLYGASVQGIQEFIFKTNKLQEIVGASEIVKNISTLFEEHYNADEIILNAAGNIKAVFNSKEACETVVLEFSKLIMQKAYGITISQAVVKLEAKEIQEDINKLEQKLKVQRNRPSIPLDLSINIMKLNPSTAKPAIKKEKEKYKDVATSQKLQAYKHWLNEKPRNKEFRDISDFSNTKNKVAVIHIDGNGLGELIPNLTIPLSKFSKALDDATQKAFDEARDESMSIREVVLGGDDVTVICSADDALLFTKRFLENFEKNTNSLGKDGLTACAGIAYCNEKYPFHYAVDLAEELCGVAKDHSERKHSCLMFHNIQSSNFQSWDKFVKEELTIANNKQTIRCDFGAYYLSKDEEANIGDFINSIEAYRCDGSPISRLREWLSELYKDDTNAKNLLKRINTITEQKKEWNCEIMNKNLKFFNKNLSNDNLLIQKDKVLKTPIYDVLQILSATGVQK